MPSYQRGEPQTFDPHNTEALSRFDFTLYLRNSTLVTVGATVLTPGSRHELVTRRRDVEFRARNRHSLTLATSAPTPRPAAPGRSC